MAMISPSDQGVGVQHVGAVFTTARDIMREERVPATEEIMPSRIRRIFGEGDTTEAE